MTVASHEIHMTSFLTTEIEQGLPRCVAQAAVMLAPQPQCAVEHFLCHEPHSHGSFLLFTI